MIFGREDNAMWAGRVLGAALLGAVVCAGLWCGRPGLGLVVGAAMGVLVALAGGR